MAFVKISMSTIRLLLAALLTTLASAEVITLVTGNRNPNSPQPILSQKSITLEEGDILTTLFISNEAWVDVTIGNILVRIDANNPEQRNLPVVAGPATVRIANFTNLNASLATFSIKRVNTAQATPPEVAVIPDDGSGDHEVRLESSTDMVSWTPTQAGLFSSASAARFFRVRVTKKPLE